MDLSSIMAATRARGRGWWRRTAPTVAAALLVVVGCSYSEREPGLLDRDTPQPSVEPPSSKSSPTATPVPVANPALPVAGEAVWTSADGLDVQVRFAVHAVRRVDGGTVLDWSVTPIRASHLRPGDAVPDSVDLGLSRRWESSANVFLIDARRRAVYRPLSRAPDSDYCLCTPIWLSQRSLRIGVTTLLQVAFPELPDAVRTVDVDIPTVPQFWRVPVTPVGQVPVARRPTDLTRPAEAHPRVARSGMFRYGASEQIFRVRVHRVIAGGTFTSLEWAIVSVTGGNGVETASAPPFASTDAAKVTAHNPVAASGPVLQVNGDGTILHARVMTSRVTSGEAEECMCTDLRSWAAVLRQPDKVATVVTNYPALPKGTQQVQVVFEGLDPMTVRVTPAADATLNTAGPVPTNSKFWRLRRNNPRPGWQTGEWPTPVPTRAQLESYTATVDLIR
jgi:hypothetical protein